MIIMTLYVSGQQTDTATRVHILSHVEIRAEQQVEGFTFYRGNKLSTTEDILSKLPGVNLIKRGAFGLEPVLRVYSSNQINLTIDGMKMYGACTDKMDPVSIYVEPNSIDAIQVYHGASGTETGSTIGGSLNLQLKQPDFNCHRTLRLQAAQSYSSANKGFCGNFSIETSRNKLALRLSGVYRKANNYKASDATEIPYSGYNKYGVNTGIAYKPNKKNTLRIDYLYDLGKQIGFPSLTMDVGKAVAHIASATHFFQPLNGIIQSAETKVYFNTVYHSMDDTHRPNVIIHMDMPGWSETIGFWHQLKVKKNRHIMNLRLDGHRAYTRADMTMYVPTEKPMFMQTLPTNNINNCGLHVNYIYSKDSLYFISGAIRVDYYRQWAEYTIGALQWEVMDHDITVPQQDMLKNISVAHNRKLNKWINLQQTVSYGERLPSSNERYGFYLFNRLDGFDYIGDPELVPEQAIQAEVQLKINRRDHSWFLQYYYHYINNYIYPYQLENYSPMTIGARGTKSYTNINYATVQGFEFGGQWEISEQWVYIVNGKFAYASTHSATPLAQVMPYKTQQAIRYKHRLLLVQTEYDIALAQKRINHQSGEESTPAFQLMNIRTSKNITIKKHIIQIGLACENVWDKNYREHMDWGSIPRTGRNWLINLGILIL